MECVKDCGEGLYFYKDFSKTVHIQKNKTTNKKIGKLYNICKMCSH